MALKRLRLSKLEAGLRHYGPLSNEDRMRERLMVSLIALFRWCASSKRFTPAEVEALRAALCSPTTAWPLDDARLRMGLGVERRCPPGLLRSVRSAWHQAYEALAMPQGWPRELVNFPVFLPSGRLILAAANAFWSTADEEERARIIKTVDGMVQGEGQG